MFLKKIGIDSICSKLLKTVGLLSIRLDLTMSMSIFLEIFVKFIYI